MSQPEKDRAVDRAIDRAIDRAEEGARGDGRQKREDRRQKTVRNLRLWLTSLKAPLAAYQLRRCCSRNSIYKMYLTDTG